MNFSSTAVISLWWLVASNVDAFTTTTTTSPASSSTARLQRHPSQLSMLLPKERFDAVITTKRNKDLGYDDRTGRFFELQEQQKGSNDDSQMTTAARSGYSLVVDKPTAADEDTSSSDESESDMIEATAADAESSDISAAESGRDLSTDIPAMPEDGFAGMDITGEINGVKMTSSSSSNKQRKSLVEEEKDVSAAMEETIDASLDSIQPNDGAAKNSLADRITNSGAVSAAAMATAAVNAAVSMKSLTAPSVDKSYISLDDSKEVDADGLPLVYDKDLIEGYWRKERGALNERWSYFVGKAVPFLTKLVTLFISEGEINERHVPGLSRRARMDLQDLGATFIKLGQMMSVRPDVLPQATLDELTVLQDSVEPFDTKIAVRQIEEELGGPLGQFFTSISEEPVAAASLAQVYLATLNDGKDTKVAVKVQRPNVLSDVSKDLYVLRRAAEVFQGLVERFAPQQKTNYVALLNEWAIGFYTELDFVSEGKNQERLRTAMIEKGIKGITVPRVYSDYTTRRVLVSEWMDGEKLSNCSPEEIKDITKIAQEAFLTQLFETGFFHADVSDTPLCSLLSCTCRCIN